MTDDSTHSADSIRYDPSPDDGPTSAVDSRPTSTAGLGVDLTATFSAPGADEFVVRGAFEVDPGETLVLLGPSGSGKSLLLESLAGFHDCEGVVTVDGDDVSALPPERRDFGFVFQEYALFPHLSVAENIRFSERYRETTDDFDALVADLGIRDLLDRYPPTLSGGEKQRVALARSLFSVPRLLLLDEPLSALDVPTRQALRTDLLAALADVTTVYVTHDRTTARALADRIAVVNDGRIVQIGTPTAVFECPESPFVARFTGANVVDAAALGIGGFDGATFSIRPEHVVVDGDSDAVSTANSDVADAADPNARDAADPEVTGTVERVIREDATYRVTLSFSPGVGFDGGSSGDTSASGNSTADPPIADHTIDAFVTDPPPVDATVGLRFPPAYVTRLEE